MVDSSDERRTGATRVRRWVYLLYVFAVGVACMIEHAPACRCLHYWCRCVYAPLAFVAVTIVRVVGSLAMISL